MSNPHRRRNGIVLVCVALAASTLQWGSSASAAPIDVGSWTAPFNIPLVAIHATLLHDGKVLLFERVAGPSGGSKAYLLDTNTLTTTSVSITRRREVFCAGQNILPNGDVFVTGGHPPGGSKGVGVPETEVYKFATGTWQPGPTMSGARWYPTNVELANGKVLIFGGQVVGGTFSNTVEEYDPVSGTLTTRPASATRKLNIYPRLNLLPTGRIFMSGLGAASAWFDPATNQWTNGPRRHSSNGSSVLMPDLHTVLTAGGKSGGNASAVSEMIDLNATNPKWTPVGSLHHARAVLNLVTLADGAPLVAGGGLNPLYTNPVFIPELFDPVTKTWKDMAPQTAPRMYHSTLLLLPDGRVLSAGEDHGAYATTAEIYSPPYLFKGPRPVIGSAPSSLGYGEAFTIGTSGGTSVASAALVRAGTVTHGDNFDQRYIPLSFTHSGSDLLATAPPNGNTAPPGWYMLFLVSDAGVPSVSSWVHLT